MWILGILFVCLQLPNNLTANSCPTRLRLTAEETPQYISSPNYPGYYGQRYSCSWVIFANATYDDVVIEMLVLNSSMEPATGCWRDSVEVIDGTRDFHAPLKSWCGSGGPSGSFTTTGSEALVLFNTNFKKNDYFGFLMSYKIVKKHKYTVNHQPLTPVNYVLMSLSAILIGGMLLGLLAILILRKYQALKHRELLEKDE